ncbi:hypothetical protein [Kribbella deserti]|uniref:PH domain-containing protein n=1 Tax=Kribbella deserti TaxID=1926257 RepID=A0ABV6QKI2_9ACTN
MRDNEPAPRRLAWGPRVAIGLAPMTVLTALITGVARGSSVLAEVCLLAGLVAALLFGTLAIMCVGFRPRVRGRYLEAGTVLGRQSLDLTAIRRAGIQTGRAGSRVLLLSDPVTTLALPLPVDRPVTAALRQALLEAGQRGVVLPQRITNHFGLPPVPGAPRTGHFHLPVFLGIAVACGIAGLLFAFAWR